MKTLIVAACALAFAADTHAATVQSTLSNMLKKDHTYSTLSRAMPANLPNGCPEGFPLDCGNDRCCPEGASLFCTKLGDQPCLDPGEYNTDEMNTLENECEPLLHCH